MNWNFPELLYPFANLPSSYCVLDLETTGLPDAQGMPGIVEIGIAYCEKNKCVSVINAEVRPHRPITSEAENVHKISNKEAMAFPLLKESWEEVCETLSGQLVICHNAQFDWVILRDRALNEGLLMPEVKGVFCSQRSSHPWADAEGIEVSSRGPSLDKLTEVLNVEDLRATIGGRHRADLDAEQTISVVECLRQIAKQRMEEE